jgi:hypothetical protein
MPAPTHLFLLLQGGSCTASWDEKITAGEDRQNPEEQVYIERDKGSSPPGKK